MTVLEQRAYESIVKMAHKDEPGYWTKLRHQAAISAMQGVLAHGENYGNSREDVCNKIANYCLDVADTLIKKLKGDGK